MKTKYKYLNFVGLQFPMPGKKTLTFEVWNHHTNEYLGRIKWDRGWRQYCYFTPDSVYKFSKGCLNDIAHFIDQLMKVRKK